MERVFQGKEYAIKVYKTSILVFKDRDKYVSGEYRYRHGYCRSNPRKMVKVRSVSRVPRPVYRAPCHAGVGSTDEEWLRCFLPFVSCLCSFGEKRCCIEKRSTSKYIFNRSATVKNRFIAFYARFTLNNGSRRPVYFTGKLASTGLIKGLVGCHAGMTTRNSVCQFLNENFVV